MLFPSQYLVSVGLLGDPLGDLHGAIPDFGQGRVHAAHGVVAVRDLETKHCFAMGKPGVFVSTGSAAGMKGCEMWLLAVLG